MSALLWDDLLVDPVNDLQVPGEELLEEADLPLFERFRQDSVTELALCKRETYLVYAKTLVVIFQAWSYEMSSSSMRIRMSSAMTIVGCVSFTRHELSYPDV